MFLGAPFLMLLSALVSFAKTANEGLNWDQLSLPEVSSEREVVFADYSGQLVLLDFFAYWCAPCRDASKGLSREIETYYSERNGNPAGIPVHVLGINIEPSRPDKTIAFVKQTGMSKALHDEDGVLVDLYGVEVLPTLVLLDFSNPSSPEVVHKSVGYFGAEEWRHVIDQVSR